MTEKPKPPSFDEIMKAASRPPEPVRKEVPKPPAAASEPPRRKPSVPTFAEIIGSVELRPEDRAPRPPPRKRKEERKAPIVVRKPPLGKAEEQSAPPPAAAAEEHAPEHTGEEPAFSEQPPRAIPESSYARPGADENADFAALLAESEKTPRKQEKLRLGQRIAARVAHVGAEIAYLDLGGKGEAIIDLRELRNEKGELLVHPGDTVEAYVLSLAEGTAVMTRSVPKGAGREMLQQALESKVPVEGTVTAQNKGGLEVDLGGLRAFCPASQIDVRFVEDPAQFVGQKLKFRVMEIRGGNAILSRRALIEEERAAQAAELRKKLEVGAVLDGTVSSVRDFGAFVDMGGLEGLVHVSELSHQRVAHAQDVVKPGEKVRVQVLRIDKDEKGHERIALSLRALEQDPWDAARPQLKEGVRLQGKVARLQPFGAFVELFPGIDGLVHVSALSNRHIQHPREVVKEGETIWVQVESIDDAQRRIALRRISEDEAEAAPAPEKKPSRRPRVGDVVDAKVDRVEAYGVFVSWPDGKGLVPNAELGTPRGSDNRKTTPVGSQFKAQIVDLDERGRYRLSRTAVERSESRSDYEAYRRKAPPPGKGFGTLGDLMRAKLQAESEQEE
ncbi:MAG TPA: 30S ribosomal protein S1 [Myxococcales bacterium]|nr:30S ribosomal protein S1 [Myxococcales bacterium]